MPMLLRSSRGWGRVFILLAILVGAPALAQAQQLQVIARGTIPPVCTISVGAPFPAADLSTSGSISAAALVDCNKGFTIHVRSENGAVRTAQTAPQGFVSSLNYNFSLSLPLDGSASPLTLNCASNALAVGTGCNATSSGKTAISRTASLQVGWTVPAPPTRLVAGSYSDTLTVSIAAAP